MLGFASGLGTDFGANALVDTEVEIAKSSRVVLRAAGKLDIGKWPEFAKKPPLWETIGAMVGLGKATAIPDDSGAFDELPQPEQVRLTDELTRELDVHRVALTSVISLSATAITPDKAAAIANALANAYLADQVEAKVSSSERAAGFLRQRVDGLAASIASQEIKVDTFVRDTLSRLGTPEAQALLAQLKDEARQRQSQSDTLAQMQAALRSNDYAALARFSESEQKNYVEQRRALVDQLSGENDAARIAAAQAQLDALNQEIKGAAQKQAATLQTAIASSTGESADTLRQIESTLGDLNLPKDVSVELFRLQRDAEASRTLYDSYLTKLRQVEQQTDFNIPDSRVIATAVAPIKPSFPPVKLILLGSLLLSLGAGAGLAFLRENVVGGITSVEQFENFAGMRTIASVPRYSGEGSKQPEDTVATRPLSSFAEAIRRIARGLEDGEATAAFVCS